MMEIDNAIIVVSGLPRSGTSMMMKMLNAGGIEPVTDNLRTADEDNPKGYYELEKVKQLDKDNSWIGDCQGKALKVISMLLKPLPATQHYKIIFMRRKMEEILASQRQMLIRRGQADTIPDVRMAEMYQKHLKDIEAFIEKQPHMECLYISYNEVLENPAANVETVNRFLGGHLHTAAMLEVVDRALHRQRG
ncbi:MAG: sulfotransferase domain-containing protein [Acidobacteria bacterium]|nr:sulfotransferase domain-containing protein [Acidobacteriota bacterium]